MTFPERWVREFEDSRPFHYKIHKIKSLTYFQATSWGGFFSYKHERNHVDGMKHFFNDFREDELEHIKRVDDRMAEKGYERIPYTFEWIEHEDLYAFYDYIGYNRHTKKFERS